MNVSERLAAQHALEGAGVEGVASVSGSRKPVASAAKQQSDDSAQLSSAAHLAGRAMELPEVREEKVATIRDAIASGTYHVDASAVAQSMLDALQGGVKSPE